MENNDRSFLKGVSRPALWILGVFMFLALARDLISNGRPLYCRIEGVTYFPGLRSIWAGHRSAFPYPILNTINSDDAWATYPYESVLFAPIPFQPGKITTFESQPPFSLHPGYRTHFRHWLGTDAQGRDVAAGIVAGARVALFAGCLAAGISLVLGFLLGGIAGYFGDQRLRLRLGVFWIGLLSVVMAVLYITQVRLEALKYVPGAWTGAVFSFIGLVASGILLGKGLSRLPLLNRSVTIPADFVIMRLAEIFKSIPVLILLLTVVATSPDLRSVWLILGLIGIFSWPGVASFVRAELLKVREMDYIAAARVMGLPDYRILWRHALPNAVKPAMVSFTLGVAGAILSEAALSFLNFSDPALNGASWGSLLNSAQSNFAHWWVALAPGLCICLTILSLYSLTASMNRQRS
jgi:peptide/nickel transport system permease protein